MFIPVLAVGMARMGLLALGFGAREANPDAWTVQVLAWCLAFSAVAIALGFLISSLRWQLDAGGGLHRLAEWVREVPDPSTLRQAMADAFGDRNLRILLPTDPDRSSWVDADSAAVARAAPGPGFALSEVRDYHGAVVAAVMHDEALLSSPRFLDAGLGIAGVVLTNQRLATEAEEATREVAQSRMRIAATAERERRRIERDLHDGAQQRLVALRIELELTEELVRTDPEGGITRLRELEQDVDEALEELRSLAHGVYPPLLADRGLDEAIRRVTAGCPIPVHVNVRDVERYSAEVESAVYFCIMEALQNVLKHAEGARHVIVRLDGGFPTQLRFSVRDDGAGARDDSVDEGAGITNMRDRLAAVGGEVTITSLRAVGTAVRARVPIAGQRVR
jgi:signal transduction histidine kinase